MAKEISMLYVGRKGYGKTVALHSMYHTMAKGIEIILPDGAARIHMEQIAAEGKKSAALQGEYNFIPCEGVYKRVLPGSTNKYSHYKFALYKNQESICFVETLDYDGRLISGLDDSSPDWTEFEAAMKRASAIVYLISGESLLEERQRRLKRTVGRQYPEDSETEEAAGGEADYIRTVMHVARKVRDICPPLIFYVTKSELLPKKVDVMAVLERFIRINNLIFPNTIILGCQSALGKTVVISECGGRQIIKDGYEPRGFELPLLLTMGYRFSRSWEKLATMGLTLLGGIFTGRLSDRMKDSAAHLDEKIQPARDILTYIQNSGFSVLYIDINGEKKDIADLLK